MLYSIRGKLIHTEPQLAVVECGGVGYACRTTQTTLSAIGHIGDEVQLFTQLSVREENIELFGFADREELHCFHMLMTVSGIGAKAALSILSELPVNRLALLIASGDAAALTKVRGIGKKSAERIIVELKDKMAKANPAFRETSSASTPAADNFGEAMAALLVLGYRQEEVMPVVLRHSEADTAEEIIRLTLKELGKRTS